MRHFKWTLGAVLILLFSACNAVVSEQPMGEKPLAVTAKDWEGTWVNGEGAGIIKVVDPEKGLLQAAWIEGNSQDMESYQIFLRELGPWIVASVKIEGRSGLVRYGWARVNREDGQIVVWDPSVKSFKQLVEAGKLPGVIEQDDVILGDLKPEHYDLLTSGSEGVLFDWDEPVVLLRIGH